MDTGYQLFTSLRYDPLLLQSTANIESWPTPNPKPCPFYMLPYHRDRMLQATEHFGWTKAASAITGAEGFEYLLEKLEENIYTTSSTPLGVKALLNHDGVLTIKFEPLPLIHLENLFPARIPPPSSAAQPKVSFLTGGALTLGDGDSAHGDPKKGEPFTIVPDTIRATPSSYTLYKTTNRDMYTHARERAGISPGDRKEVLIISEVDGAIMEGAITSVYFWREGKWITPPRESGGQIGTTRRWLLDKGMCVEGVMKVDSLVDGEECWVSNGFKGLIWSKVKL